MTSDLRTAVESLMRLIGHAPSGIKPDVNGTYNQRVEAVFAALSEEEEAEDVFQRGRRQAFMEAAVIAAPLGQESGEIRWKVSQAMQRLAAPPPLPARPRGSPPRSLGRCAGRTPSRRAWTADAAGSMSVAARPAEREAASEEGNH